LNKFAFIVHPNETGDLWRFPFSGLLPGRLLEGLHRFAPPLKLAEITGIESSLGTTGGFLISVPLTTRQTIQLPRSVLVGKIVRAARMAQRLGATILGLGEFAPLLGEGGHGVGENLGLAVTSGFRYSLFTGLAAALDAAVLMGHNLKKAHVVVLDAAGPVGSACALLLAGRVMRMTLVDKEKRKLNDLAGKIMFDSGLSVGISPDDQKAVGTAHIVVAPQGQAMDSRLLPGAVVCNMVSPPYACRQPAVEREDVLTVEGALIKVPGKENINLMPGVPPGMICPSLAETILLAMEGRRENYWPVSRVAVVQVRQMAALAEKYGFRTAGLRGIKGPLTPADIEKVRDNARKKGFGENPVGLPMEESCCNSRKMP